MWNSEAGTFPGGRVPVRMSPIGLAVKGRVLCSRGGQYDVETERGVLTATLRGRIKRGGERTGEKVVVGDEVTLAEAAEGEGRGSAWIIEDVHERRTALVRRAPGKAPRPKPVVANVDLLLVVFAVRRPEPNLRMLDRFLVLAEVSDIHAHLVINKVELATDPAELGAFDIYREIGYPVLHTSVETGQGIDALRDLIRDRVSALTGPSGVGKSSLLNSVESGLALRVGSVGHKGRHTTVTAQLVPLSQGGYVADTPGLREVGLWNIEADNMDDGFPEMRAIREGCRFAGSCTHLHEPGCAVREAVAAGEIDRGRFESYRLLRTDPDFV